MEREPRGHLPTRKNILTHILKATNPTMKPHSAVIPAGNLTINDIVSVARGDTWPLPLVFSFTFLLHFFVCFFTWIGKSSWHTACTKGTLDLTANHVLLLFVVSCRFAGKGQLVVCTEGSKDTLSPIFVNYSLPCFPTWQFLNLVLFSSYERKYVGVC